MEVFMDNSQVYETWLWSNKTLYTKAESRLDLAHALNHWPLKYVKPLVFPQSYLTSHDISFKQLSLYKA